MTRIAVPALMVLLVVAAFVGLAGWNRSGERQSSITVSERELPLPAITITRETASGVQLRLSFERRAEPLEARNWLTETKLRALGFPLNVPLGDPSAADTYIDVPPRVAWIVLEYDGPAWKEIEQRRALQRPEIRRGYWASSRLVPVDAGPDFDPLRDRYGAGHLIVRGIVAVSYIGSSGGGPLLYGWVRELVPSTLTVPRNLVSVLEGIEPASISGSVSEPAPEFEPRYEIDLGVGRLGIPFIKDLRRTSR